MTISRKLARRIVREAKDYATWGGQLNSGAFEDRCRDLLEAHGKTLPLTVPPPDADDLRTLDNMTAWLARRAR